MAIAEVIRFDGTPDIFVWKYPNNELGTWSQLIVNESQEAVLFKGGMALDVFGAGRHTLTTNNIPFLNKIINLPFGKKSPFSAEVWYVNKVHSLNIKWGTPTPIQIQDPKYGVMIPVRSYGQFGVRIADSKKFLLKLIGTLPYYDKNSLTTHFRGVQLTKTKDAISQYLIKKRISILEINAYLDEISTEMRERISPAMDEYGIELVNFYVNDISVPEDDVAVIKLRDALSKRAEMDIIGYNYQQERSFDTLEGAAKNQGAASSGIMGAGMGLGMGLNMGRGVGRSFGGIADQIDTNARQSKKCPKCNNMVADGVSFCPTCGNDMNKAGTEKNATAKCGKCGAELKKNAKFCPECGDKYNPCPKCKADLDIGQTKCHACGYEMPSPCPRCGHLVEKGKKFCDDCGAALTKACPNCKASVGDSVKFCPDCGTDLTKSQDK